jgi:hypothetical protein
MVLLDRSTLRLKAATAKLKKQRQCNMRPLKGTNGAGISHKKAQNIADCRFPIANFSLATLKLAIANWKSAIPLVWWRGSIVAHVES